MPKAGKTLWETFVEHMKDHGTTVGRAAIYNPFNAQRGDFIKFDIPPDISQENWQVDEICGFVVPLGSTTFTFAEYRLTAGEQIIYLRVIPDKDGMKALVLREYDSFGQDTEAGQAVNDIVRNAGDFLVDNDEKGLHEQYWRVDGVKKSYVAETSRLTEEDGKEKIGTGRTEYWDYWRDTEDDFGKKTQYLYVEMDTATGYFVLKRGEEINPEHVQKY